MTRRILISIGNADGQRCLKCPHAKDDSNGNTCRLTGEYLPRINHTNGRTYSCIVAERDALEARVGQ